MEDDKIVFGDYGIVISDEDLKDVNKETLIKCKEILKRALEKNDK